MAKFSKGLSKSFLDQYKHKTPPWSEVGYVTYKRTYARKIEELGRTEEWHETCGRCIRGLVEIGGLFTQKELEELYDSMFHLRGSASGRALWQLGTETVQRVGADSLNNCWHVLGNKLSAFTFAFNQLMLGGGVGFNIQPQYVYELPPVRHAVEVKRVDTSDCDFIVPDNREGWVELLDRVLQSFFVTGKNLYYATKCVRPKGAPIKGFGGTASGSEELVRGMGEITKIIRARYRQKLRPIDCLDVLNIIGQVVVAGNVRRSAEIAIGDPHDRSFLDAKNWAKHRVPNWRVMSNNSVAVDAIGDLLPEFWNGYSGDGEPYGLINLNNCRRFGRLADGSDYRPDHDVVGCNPCAEIPLCDREPCNLAEIYLPNIADLGEFKRTAVLLYKVCKTVACQEYSDPGSQDIISRNRRIGVGITGWMAAKKWRDKESLNEVYRAIEAADEEYSRALGVGKSIKLTTVKPSGTLSLLPYGCTPGMHAAFSRYMIRRVRFAGNDPLVDICREHGFHVEPKLELDGTRDPNTMVVEFPVSYPAGVVCEEDINVIDELEQQQFLQTWWSDNSVSATHYFKPRELPCLQAWLAEHYDEEVKTCSFLLSEGHGFQQAPLEKISRERYEELKATTKPITSLVDDSEVALVDSLECAGGHCPVR